MLTYYIIVTITYYITSNNNEIYVEICIKLYNNLH